MKFEEIVAQATAGVQTPALVSAAFAAGERVMAMEIARGTYWRNATGVVLPVTRREVDAEYLVFGEPCPFVGTFCADFIDGTDGLCLVVSAPEGAQFETDRLERLVAK